MKRIIHSQKPHASVSALLLKYKFMTGPINKVPQESVQNKKLNKLYLLRVKSYVTKKV